MKSQQKGFIIPLLLILLAVVLVGGGTYVYLNKGSGTPAVANDVDNTIATTSNPTINIVATSSVSTANPSWKTYANNQYQFSLSYPSNWSITDNSLVDKDNGNKCASVIVKSPARYDLPGYQNVAVNYIILIDTCGDPSNPTKVMSVADFGTVNTIPGQQSAWNVNISDSVKKSSPEYAIGQQIISSFVSNEVNTSQSVTFLTPNTALSVEAGQNLYISWYPISTPISKIQMVSADNRNGTYGIYGGDLEPSITPITNGHSNYVIPSNVNPGAYNIVITSNQSNYTSAVVSVTVPTAGWQTFTNTAGGYSFKYPPNSGPAVNDVLSNPDHVAWLLPLVIPRQQSFKYFDVDIVGGLGSCYSETVYPKNPVSTSPASKITLGNNTFIIYDDLAEGGTESIAELRQYDVTHNGKCYSATLNLNGPGNNNTSIPNTFNLDVENLVIEQILSTFTFTN